MGERDELERALGYEKTLADRAERIADLDAEALRYYQADGSFVTLGNAEAVREKRIAAARELGELRERVAELESELLVAADGLKLAAEYVRRSGGPGIEIFISAGVRARQALRGSSV